MFSQLFPFFSGFAAGCMLWISFSELVPDALEHVSAERVATTSTLATVAFKAVQYAVEGALEGEPGGAEGGPHIGDGGGAWTGVRGLGTAGRTAGGVGLAVLVALAISRVLHKPPDVLCAGAIPSALLALSIVGEAVRATATVPALLNAALAMAAGLGARWALAFYRTRLSHRPEKGRERVGKEEDEEAGPLRARSQPPLGKDRGGGDERGNARAPREVLEAVAVGAVAGGGVLAAVAAGEAYGLAASDVSGPPALHAWAMLVASLLTIAGGGIGARDKGKGAAKAAGVALCALVAPLALTGAGALVGLTGSVGGEPKGGSGGGWVWAPSSHAAVRGSAVVFALATLVLDVLPACLGAGLSQAREGARGAIVGAVGGAAYLCVLLAGYPSHD